MEARLDTKSPKQPSVVIQRLTNLNVQPLEAIEQLAGTPARLLTVPQELRDEIYKHLLKESQRSVSLHKGPVSILYPYQTTRNYCSLSLTCRQLRDEAVQTFFHKNTFNFNLMFETPQVPDAHVKLIEHLQFFSLKYLRKRHEKIWCSVKIQIQGDDSDIIVAANAYSWRLSGKNLVPMTGAPPKGDIRAAIAQAAKPVMQKMQQCLSDGKRMDRETLKTVKDMLCEAWGEGTRIWFS